MRSLPSLLVFSSMSVSPEKASCFQPLQSKRLIMIMIMIFDHHLFLSLLFTSPFSLASSSLTTGTCSPRLSDACFTFTFLHHHHQHSIRYDNLWSSTGMRDSRRQVYGRKGRDDTRVRTMYSTTFHRVSTHDGHSR